MNAALPRLRPVEAFPVEHDGHRAIALRDPAGYTTAVVILPPAALEIVALLDGEHSVTDIQEALMRRHGDLVPSDRIAGLVEALDAQGFLDSAGFAARRAEIDASFLASPTRPAAHAGGAYPGEGEEVRRAFDACFAAPTGPGAPDPAARNGPAVRGLIAPHIDFHRGGPGYAWAYRDLAARADADLFVVFGTCHAGMPDPFALTRKDHESPLGTVPVARDLVERVAARAGQDCFGSELAHRQEHSIEFQAVFLQYLLGGRRPIEILPILTSFAHEAMLGGRRPDDDPRVPRFLAALGDALAASGRRAVLIAGADLAHVGPRFGDPEPLDGAALAALSVEDRAMLEAVASGDAEAFFDAVAHDGDRRRICGYSPIYALLRALGGQPGAVRHYAQWPDPQAVVTFASVVF
jgi:hypothetical protein